MKLLYITCCIVFISATTLAKTVEVTIVTEQGQPVTSASVSFQPQAGASGLTAAQPGPTSDKNGKVSADLEDSASWKICAGAPALKLLDSCLWESDFPGNFDNSSTASKVTPGTAKASSTITLHPGIPIQFQIKDPQSLLVASLKGNAVSSLKDFHHIQIGVMTAKGHFFNATLVDTSGNTSTYQVLVPDGIPLTVSLASYNLTVYNSRLDSKFIPERFTSSAKEAENVRTFTVLAPAPIAPSTSITKVTAK